jgi:hypothetical protein
MVNQWQFELAGAAYLLACIPALYLGRDEDGEHAPRFANLGDSGVALVVGIFPR